MKTNPAFLCSSLVLVAVSLVPLWGIAVPQLVDLPEQLAVAKLFAEKVSGESALNLEISGYYGYRFFPVFALAGLRVFGVLGLNPAHLPTAITAGLVLLNGVILLAVLKQWTGKDAFNWSWSLALFPLASIYASAFYIGFVNFFPAIPFLILTISLAEKWFESGRSTQLAGFLVSLCLVYVCHPFAFSFWIAWALCRMAVLLPVRRAIPWLRIAVLGAITSLVVVYHVTQTPSAIGIDNAAAPLSQILVPYAYWLEHRVLPFVAGDFFALEYNGFSTLYALTMLALTLGSFVHLVLTRSWSATPAQLLLTALLFYILCSLPSEAAIPAPQGVGLAYDLRFASTGPAILMMFTLVYVFNIEALHRGPVRRAFGAFCVLCVVVCVLQLVQVRHWFERFDEFARPSRPGIAGGGDEVKPRFLSKYHEDGSYIRHYRCLFAANCVPSESWFLSGNDLGLYPVRLVR